MTAKSGTFVNIQFKAHGCSPRPWSDVRRHPAGYDWSLVKVTGTEKELEARIARLPPGLKAARPFADNEMVEAWSGSPSATSASAARAHITTIAPKSTSPIAKGDQLFNMSLSTGEREHVAFAGIIDLDGDGRPDNEQFIKILEKNNLIVDAYLDLKTGTIKGKKMTTATQLRVVGSDAPAVGNPARDDQTEGQRTGRSAHRRPPVPEPDRRQAAAQPGSAGRPGPGRRRERWSRRIPTPHPMPPPMPPAVPDPKKDE